MIRVCVPHSRRRFVDGCRLPYVYLLLVAAAVAVAESSSSSSSFVPLPPPTPQSSAWHNHCAPRHIRWPWPSSSLAPRTQLLPLHMGLKITILIVGRKQGGETWLDEACDMYLTRLKPSGLEVATEWHKNDATLVKNVRADYERNAPVVLLDPMGKSCTSEKLTDSMYRWLEEGGSRLVFVIGGAEGLPVELKHSATKNTPILLSLSDLTFTHQFARLVLIEQIYRASEIRKGSSYHK